MLKEIHSKHAVHKLGYHLVFTTKYRKSILKDGVDVILKNIIGETCVAYGWIIHALEIMPDHVHLFLQVSHTDCICDVVKTLKSISAVKIFSEVEGLKKKHFWGSGLWSDGTFYATTGDVSAETIKKYIEEQKTR